MQNAGYWEVASVPLSMGGWGLQSVTRTRADSLSMIKQRHPTVAERMHHVEGPESTRSATIVVHGGRFPS